MMMMMLRTSIFLLPLILLQQGLAFHAPPQPVLKTPSLLSRNVGTARFTSSPVLKDKKQQSTALTATPQDLDVVALVAGQENYGLAIVAVGEGIYSFLQAPSLDNILVVIPPIIAAVVLVAVSGPMITSGVAASVATGLWIATAVSVMLGASYILRLVDGSARSATAPKEIAFLGLLVAVAGFFSFSQNLIVDGFVTLPSIIDLPSLPSIPASPLPSLPTI